MPFLVAAAVASVVVLGKLIPAGRETSESSAPDGYTIASMTIRLPYNSVPVHPSRGRRPNWGPLSSR